jgi:hypothetical protein
MLLEILYFMAMFCGEWEKLGKPILWNKATHILKPLS